MDERAKHVGSSLYETDFYSWTQEQAALLRAGRVASADMTNIVEELETLGRSELSALISAYKLIAHHLLKLTLQPEKATASWHSTIRREQAKIEDILEDNPGLKSKREEAFAKGYLRGRRDTANKTGLAITRFPKEPPFTREQAESQVLPAAARRKAAKTTKTKTSTSSG